MADRVIKEIEGVGSILFEKSRGILAGKGESPCLSESVSVAKNEHLITVSRSCR